MIRFCSILFLIINFQICLSQNDAEEVIEYKYAEGYYVDTSGTKHEGQILIKSNKILFFSNSSEKKEKIKLITIDTFVLNGKRFLVIKKMKLKAEMGITSDYFKILIVEEVISGRIKLYRTNAKTSMDMSLTMEIVFQITPALSLGASLTMEPENQPSYGEEFYIIQKENDKFIQVKTGNKKFRKLITSLTQDNKEAFSEINIEEKDYYNLIEIIELYNSK